MVKNGDIIIVNFNPTEGHEQSGNRPAIIVSNKLFNTISNLTIVCPITNTNKEHPFHVPLDDRTKTTGVILCDQIRVLDLTARNARVVESAPLDIIQEASDIIKGFI